MRAREFVDTRVDAVWSFHARRAWRSLAVVPNDAGVCALEMATLLARGLWVHRHLCTHVFDLRRATHAMLERQLEQVERQTREGEIVFVALRSVFDNPTTERAARTLDAAVLCVGHRETGVVTAKETLDRIGRERFIGSVMLSK